MDENQINDGTRSDNGNQPEDKHFEDGGQGSENQIDLRAFVRNVIGFTTYLQDEISVAIDSDELRVELKKFSDLPENVSHEKLEKSIKQIIMLFPLASELKINLLTTIIGTIADIIGANSITEIIQNHNESIMHERE